MSRKVVTSSEVFHLWANQTQDEARNGNDSVSFHRNDAYSYGTIIGRIIKNEAGDKAFLVSDRSYSNTTAKHQSWLRRAIPPIFPVFHFPEVAPGGWNSISAQPTPIDLLMYYRDQIQTEQGKARRARVHKDWHESRATEWMTEANTICRFFGLSEAFDAQQVDALIAQQEQAKRERQEREDQAKRERLEAEVIKFREGLPAYLYNYPDILLRPSADGESIETSLGAVVPLHHARRLFRAWLAGNVLPGDRVGVYNVDRVENGTALQIGCHYIKREEANRLAASLGWLSAVAA